MRVLSPRILLSNVRRVDSVRLYTSSPGSKVYSSTDEAVAGIDDGKTILFGGFGYCGMPENLIRALMKKNVRDIKAVSSHCGWPDAGLGLLISNGQVSSWLGTFSEENPEAIKRYHAGTLEMRLVPQGSLAERLRAGGAGIPAFYTPTGFDTMVQHGGFPAKLDIKGRVIARTIPKEFREFNGERYIMERAINGDFSLVKGLKADTNGNIIFRKSSRNFNSVMCMACPHTIAEVEEIVEPGELDPDEIHVCGIYVQKVVKGEFYNKNIRRYVPPGAAADLDSVSGRARKTIARRGALEFRDGMYVNLGAGMPVLCAEYCPDHMNVHIQSENGIIRVGPHPIKENIDPDIVNANQEPVTELPGTAYFGSDDAFSMIRGNHMNLTIIGAMQVSENGDLANWTIPGKKIHGMGGAMDLVSAVQTKCIVAMNHVDKQGKSKIMESCTLPLTGRNVVDMIITEKGVFNVDPIDGLTLVEHEASTSVAEIENITACPFRVSPDLKVMPLAGI